MTTTRNVDEIQSPGAHVAHAIITSSNFRRTQGERAVALAIGVLTDVALLSPDGDSGHTAADVAEFLGYRHVGTAQSALDSLVALGWLQIRYSMTPTRYGLPDKISTF